MEHLKDLHEYLEHNPIPEPTHIFNWDVIVNGKSYIVAEFKGFAHCIVYHLGVRSYEYLYCWPRGEEPTKDNIIAYRMPDNGPVNWGIKFDPHNIIHWKHVETRHIGTITITRNGKDFYSFNGSMHTGIDKARSIIERINDGPINFSNYDYINKEILGHECYFYGYKAKINHWCDGQGCAIIVCTEEDPKRREEAIAKWKIIGWDDDEPKIDIIDPWPGTGFTWFDPESK